MPDNLTRNQRSHCMSRIKGKDTGIEMLIRSALHEKGLRFRKHVKALPGKPDVVFIKAKVAVFVDGDFWHGYRFPAWEHTIADFWKIKISKTRVRDQRNFRKLRSMGWQVIRLWQHQLDSDLDECITRILAAVQPRTP